jgi:hypothetical protein
MAGAADLVSPRPNCIRRRQIHHTQQELPRGQYLGWVSRGNAGVLALKCEGNDDWPVMFSANAAAELTCDVDMFWNICFVEGQGR